MKSTKNNALMQEMSMIEMENVNGGSLLLIGLAVTTTILLTSCTNNSISINIGHGTGNNVAVGDSIQNN